MRSTILAPLAVLAASFAFSSPAAADEPPAPPPAASASAGVTVSGEGASASPSDAPRAQKTIVPWVLGGLGAAQLITGVVLVAAAPSLPDNCTASTRSCTREPGQSAASFSDQKDKAAESVQLSTIGTIGIASGAFFLLAGATMYLWYRNDTATTASATKPSPRPIVVPYANANGGGLTALATF